MFQACLITSFEGAPEGSAMARTLALIYFDLHNRVLRALSILPFKDGRPDPARAHEFFNYNITRVAEEWFRMKRKKDDKVCAQSKGDHG